MTTGLRTLAAVAALAVACPAYAGGTYALPPSAQDFEATTAPSDDGSQALSYGVGDDSRQTATGGPVGGLVDKN